MPKPKKPCKDNQIRNRDSGRCVNKDGKIGKEILKKISEAAKVKNNSPKKSSPKSIKKYKGSKKKPCKDNQIRNRDSGRCVNKDGKIGKEILKKIAEAKASPKKSSPKKASPKKPSPKKSSPKKQSIKKSSPKKSSPKKSSPKSKVARTQVLSPKKSSPKSKVAKTQVLSSPKKSISDFDNWEMPSLENLKLEFKLEHTLKKHSFFKSEDDFLNSVKDATIKTITEEEDKNISYRTRTKTKQQLLNLIKQYASYPVYRNEKTLEEIYKGFENNSAMKYPIILEFENGLKRVFSGNTRMDIAFQLGINPKVLFIKLGKKKSSVTYSFMEGIHMLSLILCAKKGEIDINDINTWSVCNAKKPKNIFDDSLDISFRNPSEKLKDRINDVEQVIKKSYKNFNKKLNFYDIYNFLYTTKIDFKILYKLFDSLKGVTIERIQQISQEKLLSYSEPHIQKFKDLLNTIYDDKEFFQKLYKVGEDIKYTRLMVKFGKDGCILQEYTNKIDKIEAAANLIRSIPYRMSEDFYVYRASYSSTSYDPSEKISRIMKGELIEHYPSMISTTWKLDFALNWNEKFCCFYVIKVPKDSDYLILYDSFEKKYKMNTEHEITLNPGTLTITDIKYLQHNNNSRIIFFAEYKSYTKYEIGKYLCK